MAVTRPEVDFVGSTHSYFKDGEKLAGVSTVAKIGEDEVWGIASAWGFRIGYEGAYEVLHKNRGQWPATADDLRALLQKAGLTPWSKRDAAGERGNWVHDVLEGLGQRGDIPDLDKFAAEVQGHARGVFNWYLEYRPEFVATEVQVISERHRFAGRYDLRANISGARLLPRFEDHESYQQKNVSEAATSKKPVLCLIDLKTSKRVYPTSHFVQLSGYELASREMGFTPTGAQFVLNTHPDGTFDFEPSWSNGEDFLDYLAATNAINRIKANDPERRREARYEARLLSELPAKFGELDDEGIGRGKLIAMLKNMKKRDLIEQQKGVWITRHLQPTVA